MNHHVFGTDTDQPILLRHPGNTFFCPNLAQYMFCFTAEQLN